MIFWRGKGCFYRGCNSDWPDWLASLIRRRGVTDLLMLGDGRDKHAAAIDIGRALGLGVHIFEHGYLRPDWLTVEPFGMSSQSCFPANPAAIRALAEKAPPLPSHAAFPSSFLVYALSDLVYHIPNVLLGFLLHPHYQTHGAVHPAVEYGGWIWKGMRRHARRRDAERIASTIVEEAKTNDIFLFPLQLPGDYQIRRHAPGGDLFRILEAVLVSFARHADPHARLLFKVHPIDNGLQNWNGRIGTMARRLNVADRVDVIDGGDLGHLIQLSRGLVTVNSTVGLTALQAGCPVIALAPAIYDVPGLTHQGSLATFWCNRTPPDPELLDGLVRAMAATIQVRGGFLGKEAIAEGAKAMAERLLNTMQDVADRPSPERAHFRYAQELADLLDRR
ncbi:capsular biosynthesis protein [Allorhizobium sp. BGMRC 0089]|uniref:capsular biosynthesis protein n=1 Tax=Allorhizobium sonneratiae TaxID=2934936 RepID=UPI0020334AFA|nr:capsular biosynthesis protein [Allorhizobium sonneratiae]